MIITDGWETGEIIPVQYIDSMGDDLAVCDAARVSFHKEASNFSDEQNQKLLNYLAKHNHWSPFSHVHLKFRFKAPMFIARQFAKHVVGFSWNEVSRRYVDDAPMFWVPDSLRRRPANMKQGSVAEDAVPMEGAVFDELRDKYIDATLDYKRLVKSGICPEQARAFLPQATMTEWIWTGSLQAWHRFVQLRGDAHAQAECWEYATAVRNEITKRFPMCGLALDG